VAIYFPEDTGHEAFYMYWSALFARALGPTVFTLRLSSAYLAMLGLCAVWALARRMFGPLEAGVALGAMAAIWWSLLLGRTALHVIAVVPTLTLALFFRRGGPGPVKIAARLALSGVFTALAFSSRRRACLRRADVGVGGVRGACRRSDKAVARIGGHVRRHPAPVRAAALYLIRARQTDELYQLWLFSRSLLRPATPADLGTNINAGRVWITYDPLPYSLRTLLEPIGATLFWVGLAIALTNGASRLGVVIGLLTMLLPGMFSQPATTPHCQRDGICLSPQHWSA
jgi:hypothetical protein